jgi:hypothetical protein
MEVGGHVLAFEEAAKDTREVECLLLVLLFFVNFYVNSLFRCCCCCS